MLIVIHDCFEENFIKIVLGINVGSLVNDIVWLSYYKEWWFANNKFVP